MKAFVFGEVLFDVYGDEKHIGGASFNFACNLKRIAREKGSVCFLSSIGNDTFGNSIELFSKKSNLDISLLEYSDKYSTGKATVFLDEKTKVPDYIIHEDVAFDNIEYNEKIENVLTNNNFDIFYFNILSQRSEVSYSTIKKIFTNIKSKIKTFDITLRKNYYTKEKMIESLNFCNVLKLNEDELLLVKDLFYASISIDDKEAILKNIKKDFAIDYIALTLGKEGNVLLDNNNNIIVKKADSSIKVVDTLGAGDSFASAFSFALSRELDSNLSLNFATEIAENVVQVKGALGCFDIESVLKKYSLL